MKLVNCNQARKYVAMLVILSNVKRKSQQFSITGGTENSTERSQNIAGSAHLMSFTIKNIISFASLHTSMSNL